MKRIYVKIIIVLVFVGIAAFFCIYRPFCADSGGLGTRTQQDYEVLPFQLEDYQDVIAYFPSDLELGPVDGIEDAVEKAKAVWREKYADSSWVQECDKTKEWPVRIRFDYRNCCWHLYGTLPLHTMGGTPNIIFDTEGNVIALWHDK